MRSRKLRQALMCSVLLVSLSICSYAQKEQVPSTRMQPPPIHVLLCPDVNVISLTAKLTRTSVSADGTKWDHVRLEATLRNDGGMAIPNGAMLQGKLYQNTTVLYYWLEPAPGIKAPGNQWTTGFNCSFRHGVSTTFTFSFLSIRDMKECKTTNNQASLVINETALHEGVILRR